ncbi:MAG: putative porin [Verrucomicrobiota bacterium]
MIKLKSTLLVTALALTTCIARAQDSGALLDLLVKKKVISDQEAEEVRADLVKEYTTTPAGKINISVPVKELRIYGDTRLRYEYREAQSKSNGSDTADASRFRYRLRLGLEAKLTDNWFMGLRIETNSGARSTNITMSQTGGGQAFSKSNNGIYVGQLYIKNTPFPWLTLTGGKMQNPLVTTQMLWDTDINPEGFAQQFKYTFGPFNGPGHTVSDGKGGQSTVEPGEPGQFTLDVFANLGEFVYDTAAPQNSFGSTATRNDTFLFAWQAGAKANFNKTTFLQVAPTFYFYSSTRNADFKTPANTYTGMPGGQQTGINNLQIFDIPMEFDWVMLDLPFRVFGDFAYNLQGNERAAAAQTAPKANVPAPKSAAENIAWQAGFGINKIKKKGDWEFQGYWQSSGQYSVDPNLIDDDIFDAHLNMQGPVIRAGYALSDAVTFNIAYNYGIILNGNLGTGGAGGTMNGATSKPAEHSYNLIQVDLNLKF